MLPFQYSSYFFSFDQFSLWTVIHEDVDENFDRSLFKVPQYFNGSFQLPNLVFTEELSTLSSNESQALAAELQEKVYTNYHLYFK